MSLMLSSLTTYSQESVKIEDLKALPRPTREAIAVALEQNKECHKSLKDAEKSDSSDWELFFGALALGGIGGFVIAMQAHK